MCLFIPVNFGGNVHNNSLKNTAFTIKYAKRSYICLLGIVRNKYLFLRKKFVMQKYIWLVWMLSFSWMHQAQISIQSKFYGTAQASNKGELEVHITRNNINSFAKYQLELPDGIRAAEIDSKGGNFLIEKNKAKIVWINLPSEKTFSIKLRIYFNESVHFPVTLYQKFYYLENSVKKEVSAEPLIINGSEQLATETKNETEIPQQELKIPENSKTESLKKPSQEKQTQQNTRQENPPVSIEKKSSSENYTYKIQIAASVTMPNEKEYTSVGKVQIIQHKGMYKVMIDKTFTTKEEALQYREQIIQKGYPGAFLVKYLNGQRVN